MTQRELNQLTDKSLNAYVIYEDGSRYYVRPENNRYFQTITFTKRRLVTSVFQLLYNNK